MDPEEFLWDRIKHEENLFTARANFFLVAEAMLFAGTATLFVNQNPMSWWAAILCCASGVIITIAWIGVSLLQWFVTWKRVREQFRKQGAPLNKLYFFHEEPMTQMPHWISDFGRSAMVIGVFLPAALMVVWILLLIVAFIA